MVRLQLCPSSETCSQQELLTAKGTGAVAGACGMLSTPRPSLTEPSVRHSSTRLASAASLSLLPWAHPHGEGEALGPTCFSAGVGLAPQHLQPFLAPLLPAAPTPRPPNLACAHTGPTGRGQVMRMKPKALHLLSAGKETDTALA